MLNRANHDFPFVGGAEAAGTGGGVADDGKAGGPGHIELNGLHSSAPTAATTVVAGNSPLAAIVRRAVSSRGPSMVSPSRQ